MPPNCTANSNPPVSASQPIVRKSRGQREPRSVPSRPSSAAAMTMRQNVTASGAAALAAMDPTTYPLDQMPMNSRAGASTRRIEPPRLGNDLTRYRRYGPNVTSQVVTLAEWTTKRSGSSTARPG